MAVFYDPSVSTKLANLPWGAKFIFDNDVIRYVSVESRKHSGSVCDTLQTPLSILVHTSVPFGAEYANRSVEEVEDIILHNLALTVPELAGVAPQYRELKFYKQSQVFKKLTWREGESSAFFPTTPTKSKGVVFAGDYFTESNFEGCLASAHSASVAINQALASS